MRTFNQAIRDTLDHVMSENDRVVLLGLGVTDPKRFFGTTDGLLEKYGDRRVLECPTSENAYLGHALGLAIGGYRPVVHFQRMDFMCYALDQLINNVTKWRSMFNADIPLPLVIRTLVGMGWGQGAQHSQNLAPLLAQIPGLNVLAPSCPNSAAALLQRAAEGRDPVLFVEHRWLQSLKQTVALKTESFEIGKAIVRRPGKQISIVTWSYGVVEALRFCEAFPEVDWEIIDLLSLSPLDTETVLKSARKTGNVVIWEPAWSFAGIGAELLARILESETEARAIRIGYPQDYPAASPSAARDFYPTLEKFQAILNDRFELNLVLPENLRRRWPTDQDVPDWNPFQS